MLLALVYLLGREYRNQLAVALLACVIGYVAIDDMRKKKEKKQPKPRPAQKETYRAPAAPEKIRLRDCRFQMRDTRIVRDENPDGTVNAYATFKVTMTHKDERWEVWHRFSEFYVLQLALERSGLTAPELPKRTYKKRLDPAFLESRMKGLRHFVQGIMEDPALNEHPDVRSFLGLPPIAAAASPATPTPPPSETVLSRESSVTPSHSSPSMQALAPTPISALPNGERSVPVPGDDNAAPVTYRGDCVENVEFTDLHPGLRAIWSDAGPRNNVKVRGLTYMQDKIKVSTSCMSCVICSDAGSLIRIFRVGCSGASGPSCVPPRPHGHLRSRRGRPT
jgi:hypothetical protein